MPLTRLDKSALLQGLFLFTTGIWPLINMHSFLRLTGPKTDLWLVITIGLLLAVTGAVLSISVIRNNTGAEVALLGMGAAASLAVVDIYFSINGTISPVSSPLRIC
ncbi:MAG: hypothetical protein ACP5SH_21760 [Syntrophobacteraceae bacterium]